MRFIQSGALLLLAVAVFSTAQQGQQPPTSPQQLRQQIEATSKPAVDSLRAIARIIGLCPEVVEKETRWGKGPLEIDRQYIGPAGNVIWDVVPSTSVRSPYMGYIEFSVSHRWWVPPESEAKYDRLHPYAVHLFDFWQRTFRYEFDVGPDGLELTRALYRESGRTALWSDLQKADVC